MQVDTTRSARLQRIFCKRHHNLEKVSNLGMWKGSKCKECPYFGGTEHGDVIVCIWDDVSENPVRLVDQKRMKNELLAVSGYIDEGLLKKG